MVAELEKTVLVVDDEPFVLTVAQRILQSAGFKVLTATDGDEALQLCREDESIDLLLTDINMPRVNGPDLVRCFARTRPDVPVIFMTGFDPEAEMVQNLLAEPKLNGHLLMKKPFKPRELIGQVKRLLLGSQIV